MKLLLDTHVAIWALIAPYRLGPKGRDLIIDPANQILCQRSAYLRSPSGLQSANEVRRHFRDRARGTFLKMRATQFLPLSDVHAAAIDDLPALNGDPFDRLPVAQAKSEPLGFVTADRRLFAYGDVVITI